MATYYVAPSGGDYTTIQGALNAATSGDIVVVREGTYTVTGLTSKANNITLKCYPGEHVIVDGSGYAANVFTVTHTINVQGIDFYKSYTGKMLLSVSAPAMFDSCIFRGSVYRGCQISSSANFSKCLFYDSKDTMLFFSGASINPVFNKCIIENCAKSMMYVSSTDVSSKITLNHCIIRDSGNTSGTYYSIETDTGSIQSIELNNCIVSANLNLLGNAGYIFRQRGTGNTLTVNNCLVQDNPWEPGRIGTGGGIIVYNNCLYDRPLFRTNRYSPLIAIEVDDTSNISTFKTLAAMLESRGMRGTIACYVRGATEQDFEDMADLHKRGHEISSHSYSHVHVGDLSAFTITYSNGTNTSTCEITETDLILTSTFGGVDNATFNLSSYATLTDLISAINILTNYGCTSTLSRNLNANPLDIVRISQTSIGSGLAITMDQDLFHYREIYGSKIALEYAINLKLSQSDVPYVCKTFTPPYNSSSSSSRAAIMDAGYTGASAGLPGDTTGDYLRSSIDVFKLFRINCAGLLNKSGTGDVLTQSQVRQRIGAFIDMMAYVGGKCALYNHSFTGTDELSQNEMGWMLDVLAESVDTSTGRLIDVIDSIISDGTTLDGIVYTDNDVVSEDFHLLPASPCIGAGTAIAGITTDIEGNQLYPPYNIGPYGASSGALTIAAASNVGPVKKSITATGQTGTTFESGATYTMPDDHQSRTATGWTYGTENWAYNADGTAKSVTLDDLEANGLGDRYFHGSKGCALYSADKTGSTAAKIERYIRGVSGSVQVDSEGNIIIDSQGSMLDAG